MRKMSVHRTLIRVAILLVALGSAATLSAQTAEAKRSEGRSAGKYPRPNLASAGQGTVRDNGLAVKFFKAAADDGSEQGYVVYEPPIRLVRRERTDGTRELKTWVSSEGTVVIEFLWDDDQQTTRDAIRGHFETTPGYAGQSENTIVQPLFGESSWFESARNPKLRSQEFPPQSFLNTGPNWAYFELGTREAAEQFVKGLNGGDENTVPLQLNFRYMFTGDARDRCTASVSREQIEESERFRELEGKGRQGHVTREQAAKIAREIASVTKAEAACRDAGLAQRMTEEAVRRLGPPEQLDSWEKLGNYAGLSPSDFAADVHSKLENESNEVVRDQIRSALTEVRSKQETGKIAAGWGPFMAAMGQSLAEARQDAKASFEDHLNKQRIGAKWEGNKLVPKTIDVHTTEAIRSAWIGGFSTEYTRLMDTTVVHAIPINNRNWFEEDTELPSARATLREEIGRLDRAIEQFAELGAVHTETFARRLETELRTELGRLRREMGALEGQIRNVGAALRGTVQRERARIDEIIGAMMTRAYTIALDAEDAPALNAAETGNTTRSDLPTGVSSIDFPIAFVNSWSLGSECRIEIGPANPELVINASARRIEREWLIVVHDAAPGCRTMNVVVTYVKGPIIGSQQNFERDGRTRGGTLRTVP